MDPPTALLWGKETYAILPVLVNTQSQRAEYIRKHRHLKKKRMSERNLELIFFFSCLLGMRLGWAGVRVRAVWGQEMMRREEIPEKVTLLVSLYIKMQVAFYLNLALCFRQCL